MRSSDKWNLFFISGLVLFLELCCIRWFPAHVLYLTFFTNAVLLASFVGMSIGCLLADRPVRLLNSTPLFIALGLAAGMGAEIFRSKIENYTAVGNQNNPEVVFYGTEVNALQKMDFAIPAEGLFAVYFVLIAMMLVGPGQEMGRAFNRIPHRLTAYAMNLLGSLSGILLFTLLSALQTSPVVWFGIVLLGLAVYLLKPRGEKVVFQMILLVISLLLVVPTSGLLSFANDNRTIWSPYYRIIFKPENGHIDTNQIGHQQIHEINRATAEPYSLPYLFQRDVRLDNGQPGWQPFKRVLIIGAGSGNDVSRACQWLPADATIDAVEIDPVIQSIGASSHPNQPYQDRRVTYHNNDGRNFLRTAPEGEYDLVVFALIDSLVLQSGYSNLRLESYMYTQESFRDVRKVLKPTGVFAMYNYFRQGWISARLRDGLREAFSAEPVLLTNPPQDVISQDHEDRGFTMFFSGAEPVIGALRSSFTRVGNCYWYPWSVGLNPQRPCRFSPPDQPPPPIDEPPDEYSTEGLSAEEKAQIKPTWVRFRMAQLTEVPDLKPATDDWPFLYARRPMIPTQNLNGMLIMVALSLLCYCGAAWSAGRSGPAGTTGGETGLMLRSFFLGAGFMLVETKAVVQMALLFGSTWKVNTVVFGAVLLMSLAGSLLAAILKPKNLLIYFVLLFTSLALNIAIPTESFLGMSKPLQITLSCLLAFAPVTFAGIIFAASFARSRNADRMFGANVAGALIGGLAENVSMLLGFRLLGLVAVGFYVLAMIFPWGEKKASTGMTNG